MPLFEAPDEQSHVHYAAFLAWKHRLPSYRGAPDVPGEGMQPPLYYLALAPLAAGLEHLDDELLDELYRASMVAYGHADFSRVDAQARIRPLGWGARRHFSVAPELGDLLRLRMGTLPFGLLAVALCFAAVRRASGSRPLAFLAASVLAFNPQFLFVSGYVNNDAAAAAVGAAAFWLLAVAADCPVPRRRDYALLALLCAVGAATKYSTLPALGVASLALFALDPRPLRRRCGDVLVGAGAFAAAVAPLAASNYVRSGDLLGVSAIFASAADTATPAYAAAMPTYLAQSYLLSTFQSFWAHFGWMDVMVPVGFYAAYFALTWTGGLGFLLLGARLRERSAAEAAEGAGVARDAPLGRRLARLWLYLAATVLATLALHVGLNMQAPAAQGRHLFGAAPQIACLLALGVAQVVSGHPLRTGWRVAFGVSVILAAIAAWCVESQIVPFYA